MKTFRTVRFKSYMAHKPHKRKVNLNIKDPINSQTKFSRDLDIKDNINTSNLM